MKTACSLVLAAAKGLAALPLIVAPTADAAEVTVFGTGGSAAPLVVETVEGDPLEYPFRWSFNAPECGWSYRTVVRVDAQTNETFAAFLDEDRNGAYTPGEPFGVSSRRTPASVELTKTCAVTPRVNLWDGNEDTASDRGVAFGGSEVGYLPTNVMNAVAKGSMTVARVTRHLIDGKSLSTVHLDGANKHNQVLERTFDSSARGVLHEGDFLRDGGLDIDWTNLYTEVADSADVQGAGCQVTNVTYLVTFNSSTFSTNGLSTAIQRRFEKRRTIPTPVAATTNGTTATFAFRIDGEDKWASTFGTTYTAFKVVVTNSSANTSWTSGIVRLPPADEKGVYRYTAFLPQSASSIRYRIALYNSKFSTDSFYEIGERKDESNVFSAYREFSPELPEEDPSGVVELKVGLGRFYRIPSDVIVVDAETFGQLARIPAPTGRRPSRVRFSRFRTSDTNAVFAAFLDEDGNGAYTPGEPFGVSSRRTPPSVELTKTCAVTPRVNLWDGKPDTASDRGVAFGGREVEYLPTSVTNAVAKGSMTVARVTRHLIDGRSLDMVRLDGANKHNQVLERTFDSSARGVLHEGDFLKNGEFDIDWTNLYSEVVNESGVIHAGCQITNVTYVVTFNSSTSMSNCLSTAIQRRFEKRRTIPTPVSATANGTKATFAFRIDGEDRWASMFGTTYTAFKVNVIDGSENLVWTSGIVRLPPADEKGVYRYTTFLPPSATTVYYRIALYNAKFVNDDFFEIGEIPDEEEVFSSAQLIR